MENRISVPKGFSQTNNAGASLTLRPGSIVEARVLSQTGNSLRIQIGANVVTAQLTGRQGILPKAGRFEVLRTDPTPVLKLHSSQPTLAETAVRKLARHALPIQQPLRQMVDGLNLLNNTGISSNSPLSAQKPQTLNRLPLLDRVMGNMTSKLPGLGDLISAAGLRSAINNSGVFLENRLSSGARRKISYDFKSVLLQARHDLSQALGQRNLAPSMLQENTIKQGTQANQLLNSPTNKNFMVDSLFSAIETGIARIETLQLASQVLANSGQNLIYLEVPLRVNGKLEAIELVIEQEERTGNQPTERSVSNTIYLALSISENEQLRAKVSSTENNILITLWSDSEQIQNQLRQRVHHLRTSLSTNLGETPTISVRAFVDKFLDPNEVFSSLVSDSA